MTFTPHGHRRSAGERLVRTKSVVKTDPPGDPGVRFAAVGIALEIDLLALQRPPQPFDEDVVQPAAAAVHGDPDVGIGEAAGEGGAGELRTLVGIEDSPAETRQRLVEGVGENATSMVFDSRQASIARLAQSMMATS